VSTIISLAHSLKLKVVAEGVETEEQSRLLRLLACDVMQGFLFSKPVPAETFEIKFLAPPVARRLGAYTPSVNKCILKRQGDRVRFLERAGFSALFPRSCRVICL